MTIPFDHIKDIFIDESEVRGLLRGDLEVFKNTLAAYRARSGGPLTRK